MPVCSCCRVISCFLQRRLCFDSCPASCGVSYKDRCARVTCGCLCGRDPTAALSPACREPHVALCCCSSFYWPTLCGTALWWTTDTGTSLFFFCLCVHCDNCIIYWWFVLTFECHPVLQPAGRFEVRLIKWRDGGGRCGDLSDRLPSLPARLHAVQNEPQQGTTNLPSNDNTTKAKCEAEYFLFVSVNVSVCLWSRCHHKGQTRSRWKLMTSWITQWLEVPSSFLMAR